jgi:hypothetical protein
MENDDMRNTGYGVSKDAVDQKPGFEHGNLKQERETGGNHQRSPSEQKDISQESLADLIRKSKKGE